MGLAVILILGGAVIFLWFFLWLRQQQTEQPTERLFAQGEFLRDVPALDSDDAVLVAREHGQLIYINERARHWLNMNGDAPNLEYVARMAKPADSFLSLFSNSGQSSFQVGQRWVEASAHRIPAGDELRTVVVMRELGAGTAQPGTLDLGQAMRLINQIGEIVNVNLTVEQALQALLSILRPVLKADAGEICLWTSDGQAMEPRGWVGEASYVVALNEVGGRYERGEGITGWIIEHHEPVLVEDVEDRTAILPKLNARLYRSYVGVPLLLGERLLGTLEFSAMDSGRFGQKEMALLQAISNQVTIAIYNVQLYNNQSRQIDEMVNLQQVMQQETNEDYARNVIAALNQRLAELMDASMCGILLYNESKQALVPELPFYGVLDQVAHTYNIYLVPDSPQRNIWENQPYWISNDVPDEPLVEAMGLKQIAELTGVTNTALIPLTSGDRRIGILQVSNKRDGFEPRDIQNLRVLAAQAAVVIENTRLYRSEQSREVELAGLQQIAHAISAFSQEEGFFREITARIAHLMDIAMCGILLYDQQKHRLVAQLPFYGVDDDLIQNYYIPLEPGSVFYETWAEEDYWYTNEVSTNRMAISAGLEPLATALGVRQTMLAVMSVGDRRLGAVQISNKHNDEDFTEKDARLLTVFAAQAAVLVENSRLYRQIQQRADEAERLHNASEGLRRVAELSGKIITPDEPFTPVLAEIARLTGSPIVFINLIEQHTANLVINPRYVYGTELSEPIIHDAYAQGYSKTVSMSHRPFISNDVLSDNQAHAIYRRIAGQMDIRRVVIVPLVIGERSLGELGIANRERRPYDNGDQRMVAAAAVQIAATLDRLTLYQSTDRHLSRRTQELDAIARVSNELTLTLDLDRILDVIRQEANRATGAVGSTVALLKPASQWQAADQPELARRVGDSRVIDRLADIERAAVLRAVDSVLIENYGSHPDLTPLPANAESAVAVAFLYADEVVGVLHVYHDEPDTFDERAAGFMLTLAAKAALGYGNAVRYQDQMERSRQLQRRVEQLNQIFELGQMIHTNTDPVMLLEAIAYSIQHSVGFDTVLMLLADADSTTLQRVAHAGLPIEVFEGRRSHTVAINELPLIMRPEYRSSESYLFPVEKKADWGGYFSLSALDTDYEGRRLIEGGDAASWHNGDMLLVPLNGSSGALLGLIVLDGPQDNLRPTRHTIELLEIFAHQAAATIENNHLYRESLDNAEQEIQLNEVMKAISSTLDIEDILSAVARGALRLIPFRNMTVVLPQLDGKGFQTIQLEVRVNDRMDFSYEGRDSLEGTALGRSTADGQAYIYHAGSEESTAYSDLQAWYAGGERTTMIVPLTAGGKPIGALHLGSDLIEAFGFTEFLPLIQRMASLTAVAIQNARLFDEAVNLRAFSESIVESIQQGIVVLDKSLRIISINNFMKKRYTWDDAAIGKDIFVYRPQLMPILTRNVHHTLETGEPQERTSHHMTMENKRRTSNFYTYPLGDASNVRGVVLMVEDITERAMLEQDIQERANQLAALTEVSSRITASLDFNEVVALALSEMQRIIAFDTMTFWLRDEDELVLRGAQDYQDDTTPPNVRVRIEAHDRLRQVVEMQRVYTISDLQGWDRLPVEDEAASWMGVPLINQGEVIGVITVTHTAIGFYNSQAEQAALAFANQVAVALANAQLFHEAENRTHRLSLLNRVSVSLGQSLDSEDILEIALREIAQVLNVERSRALVFDRDAQVARVVVENPRGDAPPDERIDLKSSALYDYIRRNVQSFVVSDLTREEIDPQIRAELTPRGMRAYVLIPMAIGGQVIGAFEHYVNHVPRRFDAEQLDLGRIVANQAAIAIQNTNLLEQTLARSFELETLLEAAQATSLTLDVDEVYKSVVVLMMQALDMDDCALMLWDDIDNVLDVQADVSRTNDPSRIMGPGTQLNLALYPGRLAALNQREVLIISEDTRERFPREFAQMQESGDMAQMLVPLVVRDHAIGLMQLDLMSEYRTFTHRDVRLAQALGSQAATAIENARLSTETANRVEELYVINDLSQRISSTMDIDQMIQVVRDRMPAIVGVEEMYLALYDDEAQVISFPLAVRNGQDYTIADRTLGNDEVSFIIRNRRPLSMGSDYFSPDELRRSLGITSAEGDVKSYLGVPLIAGDQVVGVLAVRDSRRTRAFGVNSQGILTTVGAQLGAGIQNARLFDTLQAWGHDLEERVNNRTEELAQERDRIETLFRITSELSRTLDLGRVLNRALEMVATAVGADDGAIMQTEPTTDQLNTRAMLNKRDTLEISLSGYQHPGEQIGNWLITNQQERGLIIHDVAQMGQWDMPEWNSALAVLLEINDDVLGVIVLLGHRKRMFTEAHMRLASAAANQIAAAINNSDLYYIIRDQAERLGMLLVTEQEEAEKSSAILEGIADGVMLVDANGKIIRFNSAAERILEVPRQAILDQPLSMLSGFQGASAARWRDLIAEWQRSDKEDIPEQFYSDRLDLPGKIVNVRLSPVHIEKQFLGAVLVFRDITKEVEVDRMKSQFIANVSHELRTPMTSIKGYADLLLLGAAGKLSGQQDQFINTIKANADRLSILVNDLLNVSRLDYGNDQIRVENVALGSLLKAVVSNQEAQAQHDHKGLVVHLDVVDGLPSIRADANKLTQIFTNILDNAFNYTYPGGRIDIQARLEDTGHVLVTVKDTGIGIPAAYRDRVWERFERYEDHALVMDVAGTGLGLPIVRTLVEMHGGKVWFESEEGEGTTFFVLLPVEQSGSSTEVE